MSARRSTEWRAAAFALVVALASAHCAGRQPQSGSPSDRNTITSAEVDSTDVTTAFELIRKLRPQFLVGRGSLTLDPQRAASTNVGSSSPRVYVDDQLYGDVTTLRGIAKGVIESVHFLSGAAAQQKYGHDNAAGVIAIATKH